MPGAPWEIELDLVPRRRPPSLPGWALLLAGAVAAAASLYGYVSLQDEVSNAESRLEALERSSNRARQLIAARRSVPVPDAELRRAAGVAQVLAQPWLGLLGDLEAAADADVQLLAMEPGGERGSIKLSGEARSLDALFGWVRRLNGQAALGDARLHGYEFRKSGAVDVVQFTLLVRWRAAS